MENFANRPIVTTLGTRPSCEKSVPNLAETLGEDFRFSGFTGALHRFHMSFTESQKEDCAARCKTSKSPRLSAELLRQFVEQPVQILVVLANLFDFLDGVQNRGVMFAAELSSDFRQGRFRHLLGQIHGDLAGIDDGARIIFGFDFDQAQAKLLGDHFLDGLDGDLAGLRVDEIFQHLLRGG